MIIMNSIMDQSKEIIENVPASDHYSTTTLDENEEIISSHLSLDQKPYSPSNGSQKPNVYLQSSITSINEQEILEVKDFDFTDLDISKQQHKLHYS